MVICGVQVDQLDLAAGDASRQPGEQAAEGAGTDDGDPLPETGAGVPEPVERGLQVRGEHRAPRRHLFR